MALSTASSYGDRNYSSNLIPLFPVVEDPHCEIDFDVINCNPGLCDDTG